MKKTLAIFLAFFSLNLLSFKENNNDEKLKFICVSLGWNCTVAQSLINYKVRRYSFPFDWNQTSLRGLTLVMQENFIDLFNKKYFVRPVTPSGFCGILNTKYNIALSHDFPHASDPNTIQPRYTVQNYLDYLDDIQEKYKRRIKRFYNVCNMAEHVYFFRSAPSKWEFEKQEHSKKQIVRLKEVLFDIFPTGNWTLVALGHSDEYKAQWNIDHIKNFHKNGNDNDSQLWATVFHELELL